jgi:arylsulfatase A-like enzyme
VLRRQFLQSTLGATSVATLARDQRRLPNLVFFLSDDLGYADLSCYGSSDIRTPHIDGLAKNGIRFTDAYANAPVCTPTRVGFLTGQYQQRFGKDLEWALGPANNDTGGLSPSHSVLPSALKRAGYRTGIFGKWHVGAAPKFRPLQHGFDEFFGILLGNADMYSHKYHSGADDLWEGNDPVQKSGYLTDLIAERSARFIENNADNPFFLYVPFNAVHWPFQAPGNPEDVRSLPNWRDGLRADYVRMTESMDAAVGHVLDALKRRGLERDTLVIFTNDNGGERLSDSGSLFHTKGTLFEGGIRVPAIARWPGVIAPGRTTSQVAATMDFTATFLKLAGAEATSDRPLDGVNLMPVLSGRTESFQRTLCWRIDQPGRKQLAIRRGSWKYIDDNTSGRGFPELLFDVAADPGERNNLYYKHQETAADLRRSVLKWHAEVDGRRSDRA